jgi:DNA polymerase III epsilon subunit-like protein
LPTQGGYNLENLMHTLKLKHKEAHRALADSVATIKLLEVLLRIYRSLPEKLQKDIYNRSFQAQFPWTDLLQIPLKPKKLEINSVTLKTKLWKRSGCKRKNKLSAENLSPPNGAIKSVLMSFILTSW